MLCHYLNNVFKKLIGPKTKNKSNLYHLNTLSYRWESFVPCKVFTHFWGMGDLAKLCGPFISQKWVKTTLIIVFLGAMGHWFQNQN
jgi:hypothetical protein